MKTWLVFTENTDYERIGTWSLVQIRAEDTRNAARKATVSSMGYGEGDAHAIVCPTECAVVYELEHPRDLVVGPQIGLANLELEPK